MTNNSTNQQPETTDSKQPLTLKQVYHKIFAVANDIQGLRYLITVPSVDISNTTNKTAIENSLKTNFQSLADCIKYLEDQFEHGLSEDHFERFRNHNPKYKPNIQWSELSFLNEPLPHEYEQDVEASDGATSDGDSYPRQPIPGLYDSDESR